MAIDLTRFHGVFFVESLEQLDAMETELLRSDVASADQESINTIFRAAHSIKGGSATFGFSDIAGLTHVLETLLDEARAGQRALDSNLVEMLLQAVDGLRECLSSYRDGRPVDSVRLAELQQRFEQLTNSTTTAATLAVPASASSGWRISFKPHPGMMLRGNDPFRLLRELAEMGQLHAQVDASALPSLAELEPETSYLDWTVDITGQLGRDQIDDLFEWVIDDCDLSIEETQSQAQVIEAVESLAQPAAGTNQATIRVDIDKIDQLINMVGELVITDSMLTRQRRALATDVIDDALDQLSRNVSELQDSVLKMRMLPISFGFARLPRIVHDLSVSLDKRVNLRLLGEQTEVDKSVLEALTDPLTHLIRNAVDHGIETAAERQAAGKPVQATVTVSASHQGGSVIVEVADDGTGLDPDKLMAQAISKGVIEADAELSPSAIKNLIFRPGFSTASQVSDVSGRGVGLDVVRRNIQELGGSVRVESELGRGTRFVITLPLTLAIIDGQLLRVGTSTFIVPMLAIVKNVRVKPSEFESIGGQRNIYRFGDWVVPVVDLAEAWDLPSTEADSEERVLIVAEAGNRYLGLLVDELLDQQQAVIKSLEENFRAVAGVSAATILGDGSVALILDIAGLIRTMGGHERRQRRRNHQLDNSATDA